MESSWVGLRFPRPRLAPDVAWRTVIRVIVGSRGCFSPAQAFFRHHLAITCSSAQFCACAARNPQDSVENTTSDYSASSH